MGSLGSLGSLGSGFFFSFHFFCEDFAVQIFVDGNILCGSLFFASVFYPFFIFFLLSLFFSVFRVPSHHPF